MLGFKIGRRTLEKVNKWEDVDLKNFNVSKPTLICIGGNSTKTSKDANFYAKCAYNLIGYDKSILEDVDIYSVYYDENISNDSFQSITRAMFFRLVKDDYGSLLPFEQVLKRVRNLNFFTHCYGSIIVHKMISSFCYFLENIGYDYIEAEVIARQIFHLSYAPYINENTQVNQEFGLLPSTFEIVSFNDKMLGERYKKEYFRKAGHKNDSPLIDFVSDENYIRLCVERLNSNEKNDHEISSILRDEKWQLLNEYNGKLDKVSQCASYALSFALAHSISNFKSKKINLLELQDLKRDCISIIKFNHTL
ncbi:MAG: hypothetical protein IJX26_04435 [Clostridia bacterium]|nr:hypothetical protein [Clostridia bacterium]